MSGSEVVGLSDARFWLDLAQWVTTILIGAYVWAISRQRATTRQIKAIEQTSTERLDRHGERLIKLESNLEHVPSNQAIDALNSRLNAAHGDFREMKGTLGVIQGSLKTVQRNVSQLVENELRGEKK